jgi:three-Cys-motif partner protein
MTTFGGPWSRLKLDCVESYAVAYLKVMQQQNWSLHYVDAFAGQGRQQLKLVASDSDSQSENQASFEFIDQDEDQARYEFLEGSALRALKVSNEATRGFDRFVFIEASRKAKEQLAQRALVEWPAQAAKIQLLKDDANDAIADYVKNTNWAKTRALVFLDPFGLQVRWRTIEELAQTRACDVWYLFPIGGVIRMLPSSGQMDPMWEVKLDTLFGTTDWREAFYADNIQGDLFGDASRIKNANETKILSYIKDRMRSVFAGISEFAILRNSMGYPMFALLMGVTNPSPRAVSSALRISNHLIANLNH